MTLFVCEVCGLFAVITNGLYKCKNGHVRRTAKKQEEENETRQADWKGSPDVGSPYYNRRLVRR